MKNFVKCKTINLKYDIISKNKNGSEKKYDGKRIKVFYNQMH